jgi:hypothetical protein
MAATVKMEAQQMNWRIFMEKYLGWMDDERGT